MSLVPSLTEALAASRREAIVAARAEREAQRRVLRLPYAAACLAIAAATLAWAYSGDPLLREKLDRVAAGLIQEREVELVMMATGRVA